MLNNNSKKLRVTEIKKIYSLAKSQNSKLPILLISLFFFILSIFVFIGFVFNNLPTAIIFGLSFAAIGSIILVCIKAKSAAFSQVEGKIGSSYAVISSLGRSWISEENPIAVDPKTKTFAFRAIGRPGIVIVTEGLPHNVKKLLIQEKRKIQKIIPNVPVYIFQIGQHKGQTSIEKALKEIKKLKKYITAKEVTSIGKRLHSLKNVISQQLPKGLDPNKIHTSNRNKIM